MSALIDLLAGSLGGGVIGGVGAAFNKWQDRKRAKEEHDAELAQLELTIQRDKVLHEHETAMAQLQFQAQVSMAEVEASKAERLAEYQGLEASLAADRATYSSNSESGWLVMVDVVRGLVRPLLTAMLVMFSMCTLWYLSQQYVVEFSSVQVYELVYLIVHNLVVCTGIAITWWFGSRATTSNLNKVGKTGKECK